MADLNQQIFLLLNASAHPRPWAVDLATLIATGPIVVGPGLLIALWVWGPASRRGGLLAVAGSMLVGLCLNQALGALYFEPRPFMIGLGHSWLAHLPDNSFPSDHATFVWALGAGLLATGPARRWGTAVCLYGAVVAWARIYLGVHFPLDMVGSLAVAVVSGGVARQVQPLATQWVLPPAERIYEASLRGLRLPPALLPRLSQAERAVRDDMV